MKLNGKWGVAREWTDDSLPMARLVCQELGLKGGALRYGDYYGSGALPPLIMGLNCTGARKLRDCPFSVVAPMDPVDPVGVACKGERGTALLAAVGRCRAGEIGRGPLSAAFALHTLLPVCTLSIEIEKNNAFSPVGSQSIEEVRLAEGPTSREGRVEVKMRGRCATGNAGSRALPRHVRVYRVCWACWRAELLHPPCFCLSNDNAGSTVVDRSICRSTVHA